MVTIMMMLSPFDIGPDTVTLVKRAPGFDDLDQPLFDGQQRPVQVETRIDKARCSWAQHPATEDIAGSPLAVIKAVGHLIVDADTETLAATDAVEFGGRLFELQGPGIMRVDLDGNPDHVRAEAIWCADAGIGERVWLISAGVRDDDGNYTADGTPVPVIARAVTAGNSTRRFGAAGEVVAAAFTVVLDLDTAVSTGDQIVVRGRRCRVLVTEQLSQWAARNVRVVLAQTAVGGAA